MFLNRCAGHAGWISQRQNSDRQFLFLLYSSPVPRHFEPLIPLKDSSFHLSNLSLFKEEKKIAQLCPEERFVQRRRSIQPIVEEFLSWAENLLTLPNRVHGNHPNIRVR